MNESNKPEEPIKCLACFSRGNYDLRLRDFIGVDYYWVDEKLIGHSDYVGTGSPAKTFQIIQIPGLDVKIKDIGAFTVTQTQSR